MAAGQYATTIIRLLYQPGYKVYGLLDGASIKGLLNKLYEMNPDHVCLYRGELAPDLAQTAPYLVHLHHKSPFTQWLVETGWAEHWGIFATSDANLKVLRKHFRRFLMVYDEENNPMYFRFYDPRVMSVYLPSCNEEDAEILFGPVTSYVFEGDTPETFIRYWPTTALPRKETIDLTTVKL